MNLEEIRQVIREELGQTGIDPEFRSALFPALEPGQPHYEDVVNRPPKYAGTDSIEDFAKAVFGAKLSPNYRAGSVEDASWDSEISTTGSDLSKRSSARGMIRVECREVDGELWEFRYNHQGECIRETPLF